MNKGSLVHYFMPAMQKVLVQFPFFLPYFKLTFGPLNQSSKATRAPKTSTSVTSIQLANNL